MGFDRTQVAATLDRLSHLGVRIGTSSWKYPGWCGVLYASNRYSFRGRFSEARFNRECLKEYAECFRTVCVDGAYYQFPTPAYLRGLAESVPPSFRFAFKATGEVTIRKFQNLPRFGGRAGRLNENFLNANLFAEKFIAPCELIRGKVGLIILEFSHFHPGDFSRGRDFLILLDRFLSQLPPGWPYGVEIRNQAWLQPEYFELLASHSVAHIFNEWEAMPPLSEQMNLEAGVTRHALVGARLLLRPGRRYEEAVAMFQPYNRIREVNHEAREAAGRLVGEGMAQPQRATFIYVNNRLEGSALETIQGILESAGLLERGPAD